MGCSACGELVVGAQQVVSWLCGLLVVSGL